MRRLSYGQWCVLFNLKFTPISSVQNISTGLEVVMKQKNNNTLFNFTDA
jgi:hypothetical protein